MSEEESQSTFGRIQDEMNEDFYPLYRKLRDNLKQICLVLGVLVLVAAIFTGYRYYQQYTMQTAKQEFEKIITTTRGEKKIKELDNLLTNAPGSLKQSMLMELSKTCMNQENYSRAAHYWKQLADTTSDSDIQVIAKLGQAKALNLQDKNDQAIQVLEKLSPSAPKAFKQNINLELARVAEEQQKWQKALSAYQDIISGSKFGDNRQQYIRYKITQIKQKLNSQKS